MKALCIVFEQVDDQAEFDRYRQAVMPTLEPFGARFLVRGGAFTVVEGDMPFTQIAVLEFPSREAAEAWYRSDSYQAVLPMAGGRSMSVRHRRRRRQRLTPPRRSRHIAATMEATTVPTAPHDVGAVTGHPGCRSV